MWADRASSKTGYKCTHLPRWEAYGVPMITMSTVVSSQTTVEVIQMLQQHDLQISGNWKEDRNQLLIRGNTRLEWMLEVTQSTWAVKCLELCRWRCSSQQGCSRDSSVLKVWWLMENMTGLIKVSHSHRNVSKAHLLLTKCNQNALRNKSQMQSKWGMIISSPLRVGSHSLT